MKDWFRDTTEVELAYVPTYQEVRLAMAAELRRARRYERPLAVLVIALESGAGVAATARGNGRPHDAPALLPSRNGAEPLEMQLLLVLLGALLRDTLRESDVLGYAAGSQRFIVCLPECDARAGRLAVERLNRLWRQRAPAALRAGVAGYPADGFTMDGLLAHAQATLDAAPAARGPAVLEASR